MQQLFDDIENTLKASGIINPLNFQWLESKDKLALEDSQFPRIEINQVGEDSIQRINQNQVYLVTKFAAAMYLRWSDEVDTPEKAKERLVYCDTMKSKIRQAIFKLEMMKSQNQLTYTKFEKIDDSYESDIIHEFIERHSTIVFYFGVDATENPFRDI